MPRKPSPVRIVRAPVIASRPCRGWHVFGPGPGGTIARRWLNSRNVARLFRDWLRRLPDLGASQDNALEALEPAPLQS